MGKALDLLQRSTGVKNSNAPVAVSSSLLLRGGVTSRSAPSAERDRA